jgi:dihydrofolate reductase
MRYFGGIAWQWQVEHLSAAGGLLLGRRTYEILAAYWPTAGEDEADRTRRRGRDLLRAPGLSKHAG